MNEELIKRIDHLAISGTLATLPMEVRVLLDDVCFALSRPTCDAGPVAHDDAVWVLIGKAKRCGAVEDADDNGMWWSLDYAAFSALLHQLSSAVPEEKPVPAQDGFINSMMRGQYAEGWNDCRKAMLARS